MDRSRNTPARRALVAGVLALGLAAAGLPAYAHVPSRPAPFTRWHARMEKLKKALHLTPEQEQAWRAIALKRRALWRQAREGRVEVKRALERQLAKPEPDLARVAAVRDRVGERFLAERKQMEHMRLALYAQFSPRQKGVMREFLKARLARFEHWRARHHGHFHRGAPPALGGTS